jgi:hypothetical protein
LDQEMLWKLLHIFLLILLIKTMLAYLEGKMMN